MASHVWELHNTNGSHNKFYRAYSITLGPDDHFVVFNWGKIGAPKGQFKVTRVSSDAGAADAAITQRDKKLNGGYVQVRNAPLPIVPDDLVAVINEHLATPVAAPTPAPTLSPTSVFDQFAADLDSLVRAATAGPTPEVFVQRTTLQNTLDELTRRLDEAHGQLEFANDLILAKAGAL